MARIVADKSRSGAEIVEVAFEIMRGGESDKDRLAAAVFLKETMAGKAPLVVDIEESAAGLEGLDPEALTDAQLDELSATLHRVLARTEPDAIAQLVAPEQEGERVPALDAPSD